MSSAGPSGSGVGAGEELDHRGRTHENSTKSAWVDFVSAFAGLLLIISACFEILQGVAAIANDELYAGGSEYLYEFDMTAWGWTHLVIGVLLVIVAVGILVGTSWGQVGGIIAAGLSMLVNFAFLPYYPVWSAIVIALNVLIIWALTTQLTSNT